MPRDQPAIHVYGTDHSPWVQAVMLTLELKQLEYSMTSSPGPLTMAAGAESKATGRSSPFTMPALWHGDDLVLYESLPIIKFLDREYPDPPLFEGFDEQQVQEHWQQFSAMFDYPLMRTAGWRNLRFWYEWSFMVDTHPSFVARLGSTLGRPFVALWMYRLITMARKKIADAAGADAIEQVMLPRRTLPALQHFEGLLQSHDGPYFGGQTLSFLDVGMLGQFQCMVRTFFPRAPRPLPLRLTWPVAVFSRSWGICQTRCCP